MWYLAGKNNEQKTSYLLCNRVYKIGRVQQIASQNPDLALDGDTSVSRLHAELLIKFNETQCSNIESQPNVVLTDHSRFGTFVNDVKVTDFKALAANDMIRFGMNNSYFKLHYEPLTVTTSCVNSKNKLEIKKLICQLGGHLINEWTSSCNYVIMDKLTVTVKVLNALVTQKHIVTKKYFEELVTKSSDLKTSFRDPTNFIPPLAEENLDTVSFEPMPQRKTLFNGKLFVFFSSSQMEKMTHLVSLAGGQCTLFKRQINLKSLKDKKNLIFISCEEIGEGEEDQSNLLLALGTLNRRIVDETEIGLAILHCSIDKYCTSDKVINVKPTPVDFRITSQTLTQAELIAQDSYRTETQYNDIVMAAFETQDSAPFEYQRNKIDDTLKVVDTPEKKKRTRLLSNDFQKPAELIEPNKKSSRTFKNIENEEAKAVRVKSIKVEPQQVELEELPMDTYQENESKESQPLKSPPKPAKQVNKIKTESQEAKAPSYTKLKGLVYSKSHPENCIKNEEADSQTSHLKVKFESLIKKEYRTQNVDQPNGHRVNFKKFRKIPKATRQDTNTRGNNALFKSFKNEPFDVNSQFESFMSSIR